MKPIRIRVLRHSAFYTPLLLTITNQHLASEGLEPVYDIATAKNTVDGGILRGEIDVAQSAVATGFAQASRGEQVPVRHFAQINSRDGFFLTRRDHHTEFDWHELAGKTVLVDHFFQPLAMFRFALHLQGINENSIRRIDAGDVQSMDSAYRIGQGDYVHQQGPYAQQLEADHCGQVVAAIGETIGPVAFSSLCASASWLETPMAGAFMRAYRKGRQDAIALTPDEIAKKTAVFFPNIGSVVLTNTIAAYQKLGCWAGDARISEESYARLLEVFFYSGDLNTSVRYDALISNPPDM